MGLPRLIDGQTGGVADFINRTADELDRQSAGCLVRRTSGVSLLPTTDYLIPWHAVDTDTGGGMWSPSANTIVFIRVPGVYRIRMQLRFYPTAAGSPYNSGFRFGRILVGGTNPNSDAIATRRRKFSTDGEGVTVLVAGFAALPANSAVRGYTRHNAADTLANQLTPDFGGTYLSVVRVAPLP